MVDVLYFFFLLDFCNRKEGKKLKMIEREGHVYVVVEPEEEAKSPYFFINIIDRTTGETEKTLQIHCQSGFSHITYVGDYIFWIEENLLKWTPLQVKDIQSVVIQVSRQIQAWHEIHTS